jgi:type IV pilus assembly protein PilY1
VLKAYGSPDYYDSVFTIGDALSSRPVIVITSTGPRALLRLSNKKTEGFDIKETKGSAPSFRRIYMRPLT